MEVGMFVQEFDRVFELYLEEKEEQLREVVDWMVD